MELRERKLNGLWASYLLWKDMQKTQTKLMNRIDAVQRGVSNVDESVLRRLINVSQLVVHVEPQNKAERDISIKTIMIEQAKMAGPIYEWCMDIRGLGDALVPGLLALVDDIHAFDTVAKLWRYSGYGLYKYWINKDGNIQTPLDGWKWETKTKKLIDELEANNVSYTIAEGKNNSRVKFFAIVDTVEHPNAYQIEPSPDWKLVTRTDRYVAGWHSPYNKILKSHMFNIADQFIRQHTPPYRDIYDAEKSRQAAMYPKKQKGNNGRKYDFTKDHLHRRATRKMIKEFLKDFWCAWREIEGLPVY